MKGFLNIIVLAVVLQAKTCSSPPLPPPSPTHSVTWKWDEAIPVDSFNVYRAVAGTTSYQQIGSTTLKTFTDTRVVGGQVYSYAVIAVLNGVTSAPSLPLTVAIPGP